MLAENHSHLRFLRVHRVGNTVCKQISGFSGLEVPCWPLLPKFAGSNPAEAVGFFRAKKFSPCLPSEEK